MRLERGRHHSGVLGHFKILARVMFRLGMCCKKAVGSKTLLASVGGRDMGAGGPAGRHDSCLPGKEAGQGLLRSKSHTTSTV